MHPHDRYAIAKQTTLIGAFVNALLGIIKIAGGLFFHSHALVADGLHSFADLLTDCMVIFASKYGSQHADDRHPYGHQRIETATTFCLAMLLILTGCGIVWDAVNQLLYQISTTPQMGSIPVTVLSIVGNEALFHYTRHIGNRLQSDLLIANAWHHRSDAASSLIVLLGLIASIAGHAYWDAIAALIMGCLIIRMGATYCWDSITELVDTAIEPAKLIDIEQLIQQVDGVIKIHQLRSRMMGRDIFIDVHVQVSPHLSVSEGHYIAQHVHRQLLEYDNNIKDVTVHIDPEDDEIHSPSHHLPNRTQLEKTLLKPWQTTFPDIQSWTIHYLMGAIQIDIISRSNLNTVDFKIQFEKDTAHLTYPLSLSFLTETPVRFEKSLAKTIE